MTDPKRSIVRGSTTAELGFLDGGARATRPYHARVRSIGGSSSDGPRVRWDVGRALPKRLREELEAEWVVFSTTVALHHVSPDGTDKLLLECRDGRRIECVLMAEEDRRTVCVSTQVGCGMGCVFCASGLKGVERNLTRPGRSSSR